MKRDDFKTSVTNQSPSDELPKPLTALWWQKKGDWDKAHVIVQSDKTKDGAWVHALLHREEGDLGSMSVGKLFNIARQRKQGFRGI